jgi:hypothetical protein
MLYFLLLSNDVPDAGVAQRDFLTAAEIGIWAKSCPSAQNLCPPLLNEILFSVPGRPAEAANPNPPLFEAPGL